VVGALRRATAHNTAHAFRQTAPQSQPPSIAPIEVACDEFVFPTRAAIRFSELEEA
jgi:hypothetical protein